MTVLEGAGRRALVVDDDADVRELVGFVLRRRGFDVSLASSATDGLRKAQALDLDLLVCDLTLGDGTGGELLRQLQATNRAPPALAVSGRSSPEDRARARDAGFRAQLTKPMDIGELEAAIARVLSAPTPR